MREIVNIGQIWCLIGNEIIQNYRCKRKWRLKSFQIGLFIVLLGAMDVKSKKIGSE